VTCGECHKTTVVPAEVSKVPFHFADLSCSGCHRNPHGEQFEAAGLAANAKPAWTCTSCHTEVSWTDTGRFDHSATAFALQGAHRAVPCSGCHLSSAQQPGIEGVTFAGAPQLCAGCHEDVHGKQFDSANGTTRCEGCHVTDVWKPELFDHNRDSSFSLTGAHEAVPCRLCHGEQRQVSNRAVILYKGTPAKCEACHADQSELPGVISR
jgi:hypothetical protein